MADRKWSREYTKDGTWRWSARDIEPEQTLAQKMRQDYMSLLQSQLGERLPELLSQQTQAPVKKSQEGSKPTRDPVKENWRTGLDVGFNMPGGTFARHIPEGEMDEDEWNRYMTLLNTLFGRGG